MGIGTECHCSAYNPLLGRSVEVPVQISHVRIHVGESGGSIARRGTGGSKEHLDHLRAGHQIPGTEVWIRGGNDAGSGGRLDEAAEIAEPGSDVGKDLSGAVGRGAFGKPYGDLRNLRTGDVVAQTVAVLARLETDDMVHRKRSCVRSELALGGSGGQSEGRSHDGE